MCDVPFCAALRSAEDTVWRVDFVQLSSPGLSPLLSGSAAAVAAQRDSAIAAALAGAPPAPDGALAVHVRGCRLPELLACRDRDTLVTVVQSQALRRIGCLITGGGGGGGKGGRAQSKCGCVVLVAVLRGPSATPWASWQGAPWCRPGGGPVVLGAGVPLWVRCSMAQSR